MSRARALKRRINEMANDRFAFGLTSWGSLIESVLVLTNTKMTNGEFCKRMRKGKFPYENDENYLPKTFKAFGLNIEDYKGLTIGLYKDAQFKTTIFHPVAPITITDDEGEKEVIAPAPIRKDFLPQTVVRNWKNVKLIKL